MGLASRVRKVVPHIGMAKPAGWQRVRIRLAGSGQMLQAAAAADHAGTQKRGQTGSAELVQISCGEQQPCAPMRPYMQADKGDAQHCRLQAGWQPAWLHHWLRQPDCVWQCWLSQAGEASKHAAWKCEALTNNVLPCPAG